MYIIFIHLGKGNLVDNVPRLEEELRRSTTSRYRLMKNIEAVGLRVHAETHVDDGNCFFHAITFQLELLKISTRVEFSPQHLRQEVVQFIRDNEIMMVNSKLHSNFYM